MPSIGERLTVDMKEAMRARDADRLSTIRFLRGALHNAQIEAMHPLEPDDEIAVLRKQAKMRRDSIDQYRQGARPDLVAKEEAELRVIEAYLPASPAESELRETVQAVIGETGASGPADMSLVMRTVMGRLGGSADGRQVQGIVREELARPRD